MFLKLTTKYLIPLLPFLFIFINTLNFPYDPDLGWHLKYGEHFFKTGQILRENTFATEMPSYIWPNSSWLTDLISFATFNYFGFLGLSILASFIITFTFYFFSKVSKLSFYEQTLIFPILSIFVFPVNQSSFRGQLFSLLLLGVLLFLLDSYQEKKSKLVKLIIPLFLIWANLHGQFIIGLGVLFLWTITYLVKQYFFENQKDFRKLIKSSKDLLFINAAAILITLINPFGIRLYSEVIFVHFNNPDLKSILEYVPFTETDASWWHQVFVGIIMMFGSIFLLLKNQFFKTLPLLPPALIFWILAFWVRRYSWSMHYLAMPFMKPVAEFFKPDKEKNADLAGTVIISLVIAFSIWLSNPITRINYMNWQIYCEKFNKCSEQSIKYLIDNEQVLTGGKGYGDDLMTMYNWGGWMIWNYPQVKPAIDGRMHLWRDQLGYSAFSAYYLVEQNLSDVQFSKYNTVFMSPTKNVYQRLEQLVKEGKWKIVYEDEYAGIFVRVK